MQNDHEIFHDYTLQEQIVIACHILADENLASGPFGNVSARHPDEKAFWINPEGITFDQLHTHQLVKMDFTGKLLEGDYRSHPGAFIHREIYRLHKDITAIVHTHSENTVAISLLGCTIEPFTQLGASLYNDQNIYKGFTGPVRTFEEGSAIATALGKKSIVIAKNHGLFAVGHSIHGALWDMIVADMAAKVHLTARQLGLKKAKRLSDEYMEKSKQEVRVRQSKLMWESYCVQLKQK